MKNELEKQAKYNNLKKEDVFKGWGIYTIIMNLIAAGIFTFTYKQNILILLNYYVRTLDLLNAFIIISQYLILAFAIIEGVICIKASKDSDYIIPAFILLMIDNIIYIITIALTFDINNIATLTMWIIFRVIMTYSAFTVVKDHLEKSKN